MSGYDYFTSENIKHGVHRNQEGALDLSRECFQPSIRNPDYLVLSSRSKIFAHWLESIEREDLEILDVGGRLQPYRELLEPRTKQYVAIDPQFEGLADIIGVAEKIPFGAEQFDLALCAQVLSYVDNPAKVISEVFRVLKTGGYFFLSVPSNCPQYHDERWRFLREGLEVLLADFSHIEIRPEVYSLGGALRTANKIVDQTKSNFGKRIGSRLIYPLFNSIGRKFDSRVFLNEFLTPNYSVLAKK